MVHQNYFLLQVTDASQGSKFHEPVNFSDGKVLSGKSNKGKLPSVSCLIWTLEHENDFGLGNIFLTLTFQDEVAQEQDQSEDVCLNNSKRENKCRRSMSSLDTTKLLQQTEPPTNMGLNKRALIIYLFCKSRRAKVVKGGSLLQHYQRHRSFPCFHAVIFFV